MALPDHVRIAALRKLNDYCERRAPWRPDYGPDWTESKIAQIAFHPAMRAWELFAYDRHERRVAYPLLAPTRDLDAVLDELERDPIAIFMR